MTEHIDVVKRMNKSGVLKGPQLVLLLLANRRKEGWRLGDLSDVTGLSPSMINAIKVDLVKKGWAMTHYPARDLRVAKIYLTDSGRAKAAAMWSALREFAGIEASLRSASPPIRTSEQHPTPD